MSELLIGTDFSATSMHAAKFAYFFAKKIKANVILCNAIEKTALLAEADTTANKQKKGSLIAAVLKELDHTKNQLEHADHYRGFKPTIRCLCNLGLVADVINQIIADAPIDLVVIGTHGTGGKGSFLLGGASRDLIDETNKPLMLIPPAAKTGPISRIAFASDFNNEDHDLESLSLLIAWARPFRAEISLTHIHEDEDFSPKFTKWVEGFIARISRKTNYSHISHRVFRGQGHKSGLLWLSEHGMIDMLALQYRSHTFFDSLFRGSQSDQGSRELPIPVLVFPAR
jgi:nucleotide-binding universal stress UspA family protein